MRRALTTIISLAAAFSLTGCNAQRPLHILHNDATIAAKARDYDKSRADYEEYLVRRPDDAEIRYELSQVCMGQTDYKEAVRQLQIATDVEPLNEKYLDALCEAIFQTGDRDMLTNYLTRITRERGGVNDFVRLGVYSAKLGNADEAQQALLTAAKLDQGKNIKPQLALARFYASIGDAEKEVRRLRMAYFIEQGNAEVIQRVHELGETLGPTFGLPPVERTE